MKISCVPSLAALLAGLPPSCPPGGRGWCAAAASVLETQAAKPGNVHPGASFPDLTHADLVAAGLAIGPPIERADTAPLGRTVRDAVQAARAVTRSNANLGIVLAIAPLAAGAPDSPGDRTIASLVAGAATALSRLSPADAVDVWEAINLARPGGMGTRSRLDVAGPPPEDLLEAMRLAAPHDLVARLWAEGYQRLADGLVADLAAGLDAGLPLEEAIVRAFLLQLAREPDSLIARRHGRDTAADVSRRAADAAARPDAIPAFDTFLRSPRRLNPGTTADLTAAALYMLLWTGRISVGPADGGA
jgi:triphosphoribosyl-dephospho-CoA synthase